MNNFTKANRRKNKSPYGVYGTREYFRNYYQANKKRILKNTRERYERVPGPFKQNFNSYYQRHKTKRLEYFRARDEYLKECEAQLMIILDLYDL